jgi:pyrroloquinoline quinone (PQQ) biosynthesis protein C
LNAHANYDDKHPYEAMEIIKLCAVTAEEQAKAWTAAKRGLEYYILALNDCYEPYPL